MTLFKIIGHKTKSGAEFVSLCKYAKNGEYFYCHIGCNRLKERIEKWK